MTNAEDRGSFSNRFKLFVDSPFIWGAFGMLFGAIVGAVPLSYFFVVAGVLIWVALIRAKFFEGLKPWKVVGGDIVLTVVLALAVKVAYKYCPKPPTLDETATAIASRMPSPKVMVSRVQPPSNLQVSQYPVYLKSASADDIADAVMKKLGSPSATTPAGTNSQKDAVKQHISELIDDATRDIRQCGGVGPPSEGGGHVGECVDVSNEWISETKGYLIGSLGQAYGDRFRRTPPAQTRNMSLDVRIPEYKEIDLLIRSMEAKQLFLRQILTEL